MPVIVPRDKEDFWLDPKNQDYDGLLAMLEPYPSDEMDYYRVSQRVNSPVFNSPENVEPL
jgi:putative SOS response-associated peptidase YedK